VHLCCKFVLRCSEIYYSFLISPNFHGQKIWCLTVCFQDRRRQRLDHLFRFEEFIFSCLEGRIYGVHVLTDSQTHFFFSSSSSFFKIHRGLLKQTSCLWYNVHLNDYQVMMVLWNLLQLVLWTLKYDILKNNGKKNTNQLFSPVQCLWINRIN